MTEDRKASRLYDYDRHTDDYRLHFDEITEDMQAKCPIAWTETYGGHWVAAGNHEVSRSLAARIRSPTTRTSITAGEATRAPASQASSWTSNRVSCRWTRRDSGTTGRR
jgi:hypothetical protein